MLDSNTATVDPDLVLCAAERADRHLTGRTPGVMLSAIADHLNMAFNPMTSRRLRPIVDQLVTHRFLMPARRCGVTVWDLTPQGRAQAVRVARRGVVVLPESPQHRLWAASRERAEITIAIRLEEFGEALVEAAALLASGTDASSDAWFAVADHLRDRARAAGVTVHCLCEWAEPADEAADQDTAAKEPADLASVDEGRSAFRRRGRRAVLRLAV